MRNYRGKCINKECSLYDKWVYGYYFESEDHKTIFIISDGIFYRVSAESVGQATESEDKNGKEIYEGDIFKMPKDKGIVKFDDSMFVVEITKELNSPALWSERRFGEIIGNVTDNPELLGG